jgi:hypothetical protein
MNRAIDDAAMSKTVVFTHPGRLGDMVYALPVIHAFAGATGIRPVLVLSPLGRFLVPLLKKQSFLADVLISETYRVESTRIGVQPHRVTLDGLLTGMEPRSVFHLGLRTDTRPDLLFGQHLALTMADNLRLEGGPYLKPDLEYRFLDVGEDVDLPLNVRSRHGTGIREVWLKKPYVVFQPIGISSLPYYLAPGLKNGRPDVDRLIELLSTKDFKGLTSYYSRKDLWGVLMAGIKLPLVVVGSRDDLNLAGRIFPFFDQAVFLQPENALELARLIRGARVFVGCQSLGAALAEGLKTPRLVDEVYANAAATPVHAVSPFALGRKSFPYCVTSPEQVDRIKLADGRRFLFALTQ